MGNAGVVLITVEVSFKNRPFQVTSHNDPYSLQLNSNAEMWHKERAINLGIQHLLKLFPDAKKVAWIDADVNFLNPNWVSDTLLALDHFEVVQMFSQSTNLSPKNEILWTADSCFKKFLNRKPADVERGYIGGGHPGLAWAANIEILNKLGGLIDFCIHGSGDSHMANALMGNVRNYYLKRKPTPAFMAELIKWEDRCNKYVKKNIGFVYGVCNHYWHGKINQRGYESRWNIICDHGFDPTTDIYPAANGLYQFTGNKPGFEHSLRQAMMARNEDSIDE